jgi:hypothetical protein
MNTILLILAVAILGFALLLWLRPQARLFVMTGTFLAFARIAGFFSRD